MKQFLLIVLFLLGPAQFVFAQTDTVRTGSDSSALSKEEKKKIYSSPRKASIMSAILPGLGQVYNRKYWKVPIIYAGIGGFSYMFHINNQQHDRYRNALRNAVSGDGSEVVDGQLMLTEDLKTQKLYYRKFRDFAGIAIGLIYLLNIVDANVDAHLKTFDVSDDLSLQISPWGGTSYFNRPAGGLSLTLSIK